PVKPPREVERAAPAPTFDLGLAPSVRATTRTRRTLLFEPRLRLGVAWDHLYAGAFAFFDGGTATRASGDVRVAIAGGGLGGGVAFSLGSAWSWDLGASVAGGWVRLSADAADATYRARAENGTLFELAFETGPRVEVEHWRF